MTKSNINEVRSLLGGLELTDKLLHLTDASAYLVCFIPAIDRLAQLIEEYPVPFSSLDIPSCDDMRSWTKAAREEISRWPLENRPLGEHLNKSGVEASQKAAGLMQHPMKGYGMWFHGTYAALLITKSKKRSAPLILQGFDHVSAWVLAITIKYNLLVDWSKYFEKVNHKNLQEYTQLNKNSFQSRAASAAQGLVRLQQMCGPYEDFIKLADKNKNAQDLSSILSKIVNFLADKRSFGDDEYEHQTTISHIQKIIRLLDERPAPNSKTSKDSDPDTEDDLEEQVKIEAEDKCPTNKKVSLAGLTGYKSLIDSDSYPTFLPTISIEYRDEVEVADDPLFTEPTDEDLDFARDNDLAIEEVVELLPYQVDELDFEDQEQDEHTLNVVTINAADFRRRLAERQPTRISYIGLDARIGLADYLQENMKINGVEAAASILISLAWATGRNLKKLSNQLINIEADEEVDSLPPYYTVAMNLKDGRLWVRLNQPDVYPVNSVNARQTKRWIRLPDFFDVLKYSKSIDQNALDGDALGEALYRQLADIEKQFCISKSQIQNMLAETLISHEGHGCTAALLTDVSDMSLRVNLHYLSPRRQCVIEAYNDAMIEILGLPTELWTKAKYRPDDFVGMHMCPKESSVHTAIHTLASFPIDIGQWQKVHNQIVLATIMLLAVSVGTRDALSLHLNAFEVFNRYGVCHYVEKSETRVVYLPKLVIEQLTAYDEHRAVLKKIWFLTHSDHEIHPDLFFLFDEEGHPVTFHPKSFSRYIEAFRVDYDMPLNGLRRLIFTRLYEMGKFGPYLDIFIGHATEGRRPWAQLSGARISELSLIAKEINDFLSFELNWPIVRGCCNVPVT